MVAIEIKNIKEFMNHFLGKESFDSFFLEEASITTFNTFHIDGHRVKEYYDGTDANGNEMEMPEDFSTWKEMRPICYSLIKGRRTPVSMKFTLLAGTHYMESLKNRAETSANADKIKALAVNVRFENGMLRLITGSSYHTFVMDKTIDNVWDGDFVSSLTAMGIAFELK